MNNFSGQIFIRFQVAYKHAVVHGIPGVYDVSVIPKAYKVVACGHDDYIITVFFKAPRHFLSETAIITENEPG